MIVCIFQESRKGVVVGVESDVTDKATISIFRGLKINERM